MKAIESEFCIASGEDSNRCQQLLCHCSVDSHVYKKFSWGNMNSLKIIPNKLGVNMNNVLRDFHSKHYVPSNMKLVVVGLQSLITSA